MHSKDTKPTVERVCENCGKPFTILVQRLKWDSGKYCSRECFQASRKSKRMTPERRFWQYVDTSGECWEWTGAIGNHGYGVMSTGYQAEGNLRGVTAHRFSWELHNGSITDGMFVLHKCDNRKCVRPDHLFLGTAKDNHDDMMRKGREVVLHGEDQPNSKLTEEKVLEMRALYETGGYTYRKLAWMFNVHKGTVQYVIQRRTWKHI